MRFQSRIKWRAKRVRFSRRTCEPGVVGVGVEHDGGVGEHEACGKTALFMSFSYVRPEPVLVK